MSKRLIIRGMFLTLLLLSIVGWGWNLKHSGYIDYYHSGYGFTCGTVMGGAACVTISPTNPGFSDGWNCDVETHDSASYWPSYSPEVTSFLGFQLYFNLSRGFSFALYVPYWFLSILSIFALFLTRRKMIPHTNAFPIETTRANS